MSSLSVSDKKILETAFNMGNGYVLDFSDKTFSEFFADIGVNIDEEKYKKNGTSKANRLRTFWKISDNVIVGKSIVEMANLMIADTLIKSNGINAAWLTSGAKAVFNERRVMSQHIEKIGQKLLASQISSNILQTTKATINDNKISIEIRIEIYEHIKKYLDMNDYFHAVDEAYKVVRNKLRQITSKEKASDVFNLNAENNKYQEQLFGHKAQQGSPKGDFYRGVGYLHLAVQFLRNEKAHILAHDIDKNLALHYLSLASLSYDLISRNHN